MNEVAIVEESSVESGGTQLLHKTAVTTPPADYLQFRSWLSYFFFGKKIVIVAHERRDN